MAAFLIGGNLSDLLEHQNTDQAARILFLVGAAIMAVVAVYAAWKPKSVFDNVRVEQGPAAHPLEDLKRLARHWPVYPALLIWLLWNFAPGSATPLQYYLQNTLHAEDAQWGQWNAIFAASFIPTFMVFGVLCRKLPLKTLLFWGTVVAIPQLVPLLFMHSVTGALIAAVPIGLMGGVCHRRLSGPDHSLLSPRPAGHDADDVRGAQLDCRAVWRCSGNGPLRPLRRLHRLRDRDHGGLRPDPADAPAGTQAPDCHRRRTNVRIRDDASIRRRVASVALMHRPVPATRKAIAHVSRVEPEAQKPGIARWRLEEERPLESEIVPDGSTGASVEKRESRPHLRK